MLWFLTQNRVYNLSCRVGWPSDEYIRCLFCIHRVNSSTYAIKKTFFVFDKSLFSGQDISPLWSQKDGDSANCRDRVKTTKQCKLSFFAILILTLILAVAGFNLFDIAYIHYQTCAHFTETGRYKYTEMKFKI